MAPRKVSKIEDNSNGTNEEITKTETTNKKVIRATNQIATRTLRPRKPAPPTESVKGKPSAKPVPSKKNLNDKTNDKKEAPAKGKRGKKAKEEGKIEEENEGEPENKRAKNKNTVDTEPLDVKSIYEFTANDINGKKVSLDKYKGHVCIIVNVASKCGHTATNYKELVELDNKYSQEKGLRILAFPCNQFGKQEPGSNETICKFAEKKNVSFDLFEKIDVNGENAHPLWKYLKSQKEGPKGENIDWNFTKFIINKKGEVVERFKPTVKPLTLVKDLEKLW